MEKREKGENYREHGTMKPEGNVGKGKSTSKGEKRKRNEQIAGRIMLELNISEVSGNTSLKMYLGI
jgi:hypothetical protein